MVEELIHMLRKNGADASVSLSLSSLLSSRMWKQRFVKGLIVTQ